MSCTLFLQRFRYPFCFLLIYFSKWFLLILRFRDKLVVLALGSRLFVSISKFSIRFSVARISSSDSWLTTCCRNWFSKRWHFSCRVRVNILVTYVSEIPFNGLPPCFQQQHNLSVSVLIWKLSHAVSIFLIFMFRSSSSCCPF